MPPPPPSNEGETLDRIAKVIRSKNAGPFEITFDVMFDDEAAYARVKRSGVIDAARVAAAYRIPARTSWSASRSTPPWPSRSPSAARSRRAT